MAMMTDELLSSSHRARVLVALDAEAVPQALPAVDVLVLVVLPALVFFLLQQLRGSLLQAGAPGKWVQLTSTGGSNHKNEKK